jgi:hypothetical protein
MNQPLPYELYNGTIGVRLSFLLIDADRKADGSIEVTTYAAYEKKAQRNPHIRLRKGKGKGREVLLRHDAMPQGWSGELHKKWGKPAPKPKELSKHFTLDGQHRQYYDSYLDPETGKALEDEQIAKYTLNASVLDAIFRLKADRETIWGRSGRTSNRGIWPTLVADTIAFQEDLALKYATQHSIPTSMRHFKQKLKDWRDIGRDSLLDGRRNNDNAQKVTPEMEQLWNDMYSGQRHKPYYSEVAGDYQDFLDGKMEVLNTTTGELYEPSDDVFRPVDERSVVKYLKKWKSRAASHSKRSGNRQRFMGDYIPHGKMHRPNFAGSIISIDDRQPPFKYAAGRGNRLWMYLAQDLGSDAITVWARADTKEGLITEFYRQLVRNYTEWGLKIPDALECESSLNSTYRDTLLSPGAMFQNVRIIANDARSKRIERTFGAFRYEYEKQEPGFIPRIDAKREANQEQSEPTVFRSKDDIYGIQMNMISIWNNGLHPDQDKFPGMSRWDHFLDNQHPELQPTNWRGILPHIGYSQKTSMSLGRITLQGKMRVVSLDGENVALGNDLLNIMERIEGQNVMVYWLDGNDGQVLHAIVQDMHGKHICELLDDLPYHRAIIEQTDTCRMNKKLTDDYRATVTSHIQRTVKTRSNIIVRELEPAPTEGRFVMPGLKTFAPRITEVEEVEMAMVEDEVAMNSGVSTKTADRF